MSGEYIGYYGLLRTPDPLMLPGYLNWEEGIGWIVSGRENCRYDTI